MSSSDASDIKTESKVSEHFTMRESSLAAPIAQDAVVLSILEQRTPQAQDQLRDKIARKIIRHIERCVRYTGYSGDFLPLTKIYTQCKFPLRISYQTFKKCAKLHFTTAYRGTFRHIHTVQLNGKGYKIKNVILRFALK